MAGADVDRDQDEEILSLAEAADISPWSTSSLYRIAQEGGEGNPFKKRRGKWATIRSDFVAWVRAGHVPARKPITSPMPKPLTTSAGRRRGGTVLSDVHRLRREQV